VYRIEGSAGEEAAATAEVAGATAGSGGGAVGDPGVSELARGSGVASVGVGVDAAMDGGGTVRSLWQ